MLLTLCPKKDALSTEFREKAEPAKEAYDVRAAVADIVFRLVADGLS